MNSSARARSCSSRLLRFLCRLGRWSTGVELQRPPEGSAQVNGNVSQIDLAARGVDGAVVHFNAPSWASRAVMSSTILPVCPKTSSTSPSLTVHLCLHTAPGNRECARSRVRGSGSRTCANTTAESATRLPTDSSGADRSSAHVEGGHS